MRVSTQLHLSELLPCPIVVELGGADKCEVDTQTPVDATAIDADEDAVGDGRPSWILGITVEANLIGCHCS